MAAGMLMPMARFALDPALRAGAESEFLYVCDVDQLTEDPQVFPFNFDQVDAWYESEVSRDVYVYIRDNEVTALSAICTHLAVPLRMTGMMTIRSNSSVHVTSDDLIRMGIIFLVLRQDDHLTLMKSR